MHENAHYYGLDDGLAYESQIMGTLLNRKVIMEI